MPESHKKMGILFTTGGALGGTLGGTAGYAAGRAAEGCEEIAWSHPGVLPKAYAIAGCGTGAGVGFIIQRISERNSKITPGDKGNDL